VRILELRPDEAPWTREFVTHAPRLEAGHMIVPDRPGWGADVNEEALLAHPVRKA
jgi:L-alanine-DL-glutamate epimerase-like enolase superfamily enzyme